MSFIELLTLRLGSAVARSVLKFWLRDVEIGADLSADLTSIVETRVSGFLEQRRTIRQFENLAEQVATRLEPFISREFKSLPQNERNAAVLAVSDTFSRTPFTAGLLLAQDLNAVRLEEYFKRTQPTIADGAGLSEQAKALYFHILRETCNYVVEIVSTLPSFEVAVRKELLKRQSEIMELVEMVLTHLPDPSPDALSGNDDGSFELQYRRELANKLDRMELFGINVSELHKRYSLSVAYITLSVSMASTDAGRTGRGLLSPLRVDEALGDSDRTVIRGEAGSGKTTLLQWLAVSSARHNFVGGLADQNGSTPFLIQLRRYVNLPLPRPEQFLDHTVPNILGVMPAGWVHRQLRDRPSLVLVDGVDELPTMRRNEARDWLVELTESFPRCKYVVTSRPPGITKDWLLTAGFRSNDLQPMNLSDIYSFIDHWHKAARSALMDEDEIDDFMRLRTTLKALVRDSSSLRGLATNPLLCAMICALSRERRTHLPKDRIGLYQIALEMLLERRDLEREVMHEESPRLSYKEKELLLQDLAYWLIVNNQSDVSRSAVERRFGKKLTSMPHVKGTPADVFQYFLVRSGLLSEPTEGRVQFLHRSFQEYLGAKEAIEQDHIGLLLESADVEQWREVITLVAGQATKNQRETLIRGLLNKGYQHKEQRHRSHLLALACIETSPELAPELSKEVGRCLSGLVPPTTMEDAKDVASAGEVAIPALLGSHPSTAAERAATIRSLGLIGGERALEGIVQFAHASTPSVVAELVRAWEHFDPVDYAQLVLIDCPLEEGRLSIHDARLVPGLVHLKHLRRLSCHLRSQLKDLEALSGVVEVLESLDAGDNPVSDLRPLAKSTTLLRLSLDDCDEIVDLWPISRLSSLRVLSLGGCSSIADFSPLGRLKELEELKLSGCTGLSDLSLLADLQSLRRLELEHCKGIKSFQPLVNLRALEYLDLTGLASLDIAPILRAGFDQLRVRIGTTSFNAVDR